MSKYLTDLKHKYVGKVFKTNHFGELVVLKYDNCSNVLVMFLDTKYVTTTHMHHIKDGRVRDFLKPCVFGVGFITKHIGTKDENYRLWKGMLERCYDEKCQTNHPTYRDCYVSETFKYLEYFSNWCNKQIGFKSIDDKGKPFQLDKDILVKGNRVYSEDTCVFVPREINNLFTKSNNSRGKYPIGVSYRKQASKFIAELRVNNTPKYVGSFDTPEEAFYAYKEAKEAHIKEVANKWKNKIDTRVYEALIKYEVSIDD